MYLNRIVIPVVKFTFLTFLCCSFISCTNSLKADAKLRIQERGFHRTLAYDINFENLDQSSCSVALFFELPSSFYVSLDELEDIVRKGENPVCSVGEFNVESFAERSGTQNVTVCSPLTDSKISLAFPIHQRYHDAREGGGYLEIGLPKPKLLIGCSERIKELRVSKVELCSTCSELAEKWREVPFDQHPEDADFIWYIPVGDTLMLPLVDWVTNIVVACGSFYVLWTVFKVNVLNERKTKEN